MSASWNERVRDAWRRWRPELRALEHTGVTARPRTTWEDEMDEDDDHPPRGFWRPATQLGPGAPGRAGVPTIDDDLDRDPDAAPASYPAWLPGETFVVSGPLGPHGWGPGRRFLKTKDARAWAAATYGAVMENLYHNGRWALRVPVPGAAGAKHRQRGNA